MPVKNDSLAQPVNEGPALKELEKKLGYHFENPRFLEEALTHPTYAHEHPDPELKDNQRLEFLGDAVLNLAVGHLLMHHHPDAQEGELTRMRANLVSESGLAKLAQDLNLGPYIRLGKGERATHGREKKSILADALEALMAALYLDGGSEKTFDIIAKLFAPMLGNSQTDAKTDLQELTQKKYQVVPEYQVIAETGPDHDKTFIVELNLFDITATGTGKSKKLAEKAAAEKALKIFSAGAQ
jgi:ribonuclease III